MTSDRLIAPLEIAIEVLAARGRDHGDFVELHERISQLWSAYLQTVVEPHQVAALMALLKIARSEFNAANEDNFVDLAGYGAIYAELLKIDRRTGPSARKTHLRDTESPESEEQL